MNKVFKSCLILVLIGSCAAGLSGCFGPNYLLPESQLSVDEAKELIKSGEAKVEEGDAMIGKGKDLRKQAEKLIDQGEDLRRQGKAEIARGKQRIEAVEVLEDAEQMRLKGEKLHRKSY
ncbi:hypothetical protein DESUT3_05560 [Desulfuromonas versatilis]|uniref:Lipoprotein n=1 Tax=Desulfuromonas versatilis TaxID=2802975 RepID=A0ABN6DUR8_9BACT|nr:hypothetical protein [Desulfuromonas versatilis]BCR03487.1 hypothetical protein DESUT3_05560 [Desulfuromonas versatilis]